MPNNAENFQGPWPFPSAPGGAVAGGLAPWSATELAKPLFLDENISGMAITPSGGNLSLVSDAGGAIVTSNSTTRMVAGKNVLYLKLNATLLAANEEFVVYLTNYAESQNPYRPFVRFKRDIGGPEWTADVGNQYSLTPVVVLAANIENQEIAVAFQNVDGNNVTITVYTNGSSTPIITKTVTTSNGANYLKTIRLESTFDESREILLIGTPASPITGTTQIVTSGFVNPSLYPADRLNKSFLVTGLLYPLKDTAANRMISNGCIVSFNGDGALVYSNAKENEILYFFSWNDAGLTIEQGSTVWDNGFTASTVSANSATMPLATRTEHLVSNILTPNGDRLSDYEVINVRPQIRSDNMWLVTGWIYATGGQGVSSDNHITSSAERAIVIQSGSFQMSSFSAINSGATANITFAASPKHVRVRVSARKSYV